MRIPIVLLAAVAALIVGVWAWLGAPVAMPPSPIGVGEKLYCVSYAPFRGAQNPLEAATYIDARQIDDDLTRLARVTNCIRTYSVEHGLDQVAPLAAKHGLQLMQGLWLSSHPEKNRVQLETTIALANRHRDVIRSVVVGNEVLLRGEMAGAELAATIRLVKAAVPMPVTYADVWEFWLRHRDVYDAVDFVTIHILPYWEDFPIPAAHAAAHVDSIRNRVVAAFPDKEILIGETGWPSAGRMREGALPSPVNQARVLHEVLAAANRGNYRVNLIEAFDQPWKRWLEGTVGGHWGLYDDHTRQPKFVWGAAISNHAFWKVQAAGGAALAAIVFLAAWMARLEPERPVEAHRWFAVAVIGAAGGVLIGWTGEKVLLESLGIGGWARSLLMALVAAAAPAIAAAALVRDVRIPTFAEVLGGAERRAGDLLSFALGAALIVLSALAVQVALGLVFDPRYKDFPFPSLGAATLPYVVLALFQSAERRGPSAAEMVTAAVLAFCAVYIAFNEGGANWQAMALSAILIALAANLVRFAGGPRTR